MIMKQLMKLSLVLFVLITLTSCGRRYGNTTYQEHPIDNKTIAVLPYKVITTGRIPAEITDEMLEEIEDAESEAFQASLYHQMLDRLSRRKYDHIHVRLQDYNETNQKLEQAEIDLRTSQEMSATELATILGVDAIVRSRVHKNKYLTDFESYGIHVATQIISIFSRRALWFYADTRTQDVRISSSIIDGSDATTLWSVSRRCPGYWHKDTYEVIEEINFNISRRLPR